MKSRLMQHCLVLFTLVIGTPSFATSLGNGFSAALQATSNSNARFHLDCSRVIKEFHELYEPISDPCWKGPYLKGPITDPWGIEFQLFSSELGNEVIHSAGPDREFNTTDDILADKNYRPNIDYSNVVCVYCYVIDSIVITLIASLCVLAIWFVVRLRKSRKNQK